MMFCGRRIPTIAVVLFLWVSLLSVIVMAGSTGQIKGRITDSESGEPVIGASVLIVGTTQGAYTDVDGYYTILRVDPGTYSLRITHVDYKTVEVVDVKVQIDLTTEHDQGMEQKVTELDEKITVQGRQDILNKFEVAGQVNISQEEISHRPVQTVDQLLEQVPGVQLKSTGEIFIRGGRAGEVSYIVDGVPMNDPLGGLGVSGGASMDLASGSIADIQIIKDGFDPEYG
ncbi:MAG: carboxypeptidase-like regulatory domain-containing protein, partial [Candidatus Zixiibacteriota bacterium]